MTEKLEKQLIEALIPQSEIDSLHKLEKDSPLILAGINVCAANFGLQTLVLDDKTQMLDAFNAFMALLGVGRFLLEKDLMKNESNKKNPFDKGD